MGKSTVRTDEEQDLKIQELKKILIPNTAAGVFQELLKFNVVLAKDPETENKTQIILESLYKEIAELKKEVQELKELHK